MPALQVEDFKFDGVLGSTGAKIKQLGTNHFGITTDSAPTNPQWSNMLQFEITGNAKGNALHLDVDFPGGNGYAFNSNFGSISYDLENWRPIHWLYGAAHKVPVDSLIFPVFTSDRVWYGNQIPLPFEQIEKKLEIYAEAENVTLHKICDSVEGRGVYRLEITALENEEHAHYFANHHPGEANAQRRIMSGIEWLLSPEAEKFRKNHTFHCIPIMAPDGPSNGWRRCNAEGGDMFRTYNMPGVSTGVEYAKEGVAGQRDLEALAAKGTLRTAWFHHTWNGAVEPIMLPTGKIAEPGNFEKIRQAFADNDPRGLIKPIKQLVKLTVEESKNCEYMRATHMRPHEERYCSWCTGAHRHLDITTILAEGGADIYDAESNAYTGTVMMRSLAAYYGKL